MPGMHASFYAICRRFCWPGGREIHRISKQLEQSQWFSRTKLEQIQFERIKRLLEHAYEHVPFYRERYQKEGIHPKDIRIPKDFEALPFLTREDVIQNRALLVSTRPVGRSFEDKTGGSTGQPMRFLMDESAAWWSAAVETRYRGWYGVRPGDKRAWVWGALKDFPSWHWKDRLRARVNRYRFLNAHTMVREKMRAFADMLQLWRPAMFRAYPSALFLFAVYLREQGIKSISPKLIETSGEKLLPSQRELFKEVFQAPVADHYSSWEVYDIAYECPEGGRHVSEDRYLELVSGNAHVRPGELGEVVITSLNQYTMPFIRYKNGDFGVYQKETCSCGRGMPVLKEIVGRAEDLITRPDGQVVSGAMFDYVLNEYNEIEKFQVYQRDKQNIEVRIACREPVKKNWVENIRRRIQAFFGKDMKLEIKIVDGIHLTPAGKLRTVISEVKPMIRGEEVRTYAPEYYDENIMD